MKMENQTQTLMLGDVNIGKYVKIQNVSSERLEKIKEAVLELKDNCLPFEKHIYYQSLSEMISPDYPNIDLGFLEKTYRIKEDFKGNNRGEHVRIPAFSVYAFYKSNVFSIRLCTTDPSYHISLNQKFPEIIESRLLKKCNTHDSPGYAEWGRYILSNEFIGLIPLKIKEKVKKSLQYFNKDDIFMIAEAKPKDWNVKKIKGDPLIIGLIGKNAHLIDHFDCTSLENLVKDIYLKKKFN